jgi:hypothetical protein
MIVEENKIGAIKGIILLQLGGVDFYTKFSIFEIIIGKKRNWSTYYRIFPKGLGTCRNTKTENFS